MGYLFRMYDLFTDYNQFHIYFYRILLLSKSKMSRRNPDFNFNDVLDIKLGELIECVYNEKKKNNLNSPMKNVNNNNITNYNKNIMKFNNSNNKNRFIFNEDIKNKI